MSDSSVWTLDGHSQPENLFLVQPGVSLVQTVLVSSLDVCNALLTSFLFLTTAHRHPGLCFSSVTINLHCPTPLSRQWSPNSSAGSLWLQHSGPRPHLISTCSLPSLPPGTHPVSHSHGAACTLTNLAYISVIPQILFFPPLAIFHDPTQSYFHFKTFFIPSAPRTGLLPWALLGPTPH